MTVRILRTASGCMSAIGLINELIKRGVDVICADANPLSVGLYYCKKGYVVPMGSDPNFISVILNISKKERVNAILSGPEEEIIQLSKNKNLFLNESILPLVPDYNSTLVCSDKFKTYRFFMENNIPISRTFFIDKENNTDIIAQLNDLNFPVILKPRFGRGGRGIYMVYDKHELEFYIPKLIKGSDYLIQEFIYGIECTIDIFSDLEGKPLSIVPRKRLGVESGIAVKAQTFYDKKIVNYAYKIAKKLKLIGPSNIQCILDKKGDPKFIEINPRFGGGSILSIKADPTIVENLIRIIKGEKPLTSHGFKEGLIMLRYYSEIYIDSSSGEVIKWPKKQYSSI